MRAMEAETFSGYGGLRQTEFPKCLSEEFLNHMNHL